MAGMYGGGYGFPTAADPAATARGGLPPTSGLGPAASQASTLGVAASQAQSLGLNSASEF